MSDKTRILMATVFKMLEALGEDCGKDDVLKYLDDRDIAWIDSDAEWLDVTIKERWLDDGS